MNKQKDYKKIDLIISKLNFIIENEEPRQVIVAMSIFLGHLCKELEDKELKFVKRIIVNARKLSGGYI